MSRHAGQRRKGATGEPYVNHLLEVAALVAEADEGNTDPTVAALLHDAIEDQKIALETMTQQFGERVPVLSRRRPTTSRFPKPERKQLQIETAPTKSRDAKLLKLAKKVSNLRLISRKVQGETGTVETKLIVPRLRTMTTAAAILVAAVGLIRLPLGTTATLGLAAQRQASGPIVYQRDPTCISCVRFKSSE